MRGCVVIIAPFSVLVLLVVLAGLAGVAAVVAAAGLAVLAVAGFVAWVALWAFPKELWREFGRGRSGATAVTVWLALVAAVVMAAT